MNDQAHSTSQVLLMILDGWGYREDKKYNAIAQANPEYFNSLWQNYPHTLFHASGEAVGLPEGVIGTSEIGHMILGAGKVLYTDLLRISRAILTHQLEQNSSLQQLFTQVKNNNATLHLLGLVSPGGVHSHQDHLYALLRLAKAFGLQKVAVHVITDGRDTPPQSADEYITALESFMRSLGIGRIATVSGRYYAMDRDTNWDRIDKEVEALFEGKGHVYSETTATDIIQEWYGNNVGDEFIEPSIILDDMLQPTVISQNDGILFFNFRPDRARQLSQRISEKSQSLNLCFATMTQYDKSIPSLVLFPPEKIGTTLADEIAKAGMTQAHIAETEKYAHVTYFFNGGNETPHQQEEFILVNSRKDVPTHDLAPEMKAKEIADKTIEQIDKGTHFIVINFANADMVGHTGKWEPTITAIQTLDQEIRRVVEHMKEKNGITFITADHGNAELMFDERNNQPYTAHTLSPVPGIITTANVTLKEGSLADVAPTLLALLGLPKPAEMTGKNLLG